MRIPTRRSPFWGAFLLCACLLTNPAANMPARAQNDSGGYQIGEQNGQNPDQNNPDASPTTDTNAGPVRLARFSYVNGNVTWRPDDTQDWSAAVNNLPIREGAQVWVTNGGRAEIQFDDGSALRLGNNALVTLKTLYSDSQGEFTQITQNDGLSTLVARHDHTVYQIDTPLLSVKTPGPSRVRVGVDEGVEVADQGGAATVEGPQGTVTLQSGDYVDPLDANATYDVRAAPQEDSWDQWNDQQDHILQDNNRPAQRYLPSNIALVSGDLDRYGTWHDDPSYGHVWCPSVQVVGWRPYAYGHWVWVNPFGWTWVSNEPWGWAPYHYGAWIRRPYGWAWVPGPAAQYWCPAVVNFTYYNGSVAWCPLAPAEVRYPAALSIGFRSGNWSLFFSIGRAAVYYPATATYCVARPFNTVYVNHVTNITNVYNTYVNRTTVVNNRFVPINATRAAGSSSATLQAFTAHGVYHPIPRGQTVLFARGQSFAPPTGRTPTSGPVSGPIQARPTSQSMIARSTLPSAVQPPRTAMQRSIYQGFGQRPVQGNRTANTRRFGGVGNRGQGRPNNPTGTSGAGSAAEAAARARASLGMSDGRGGRTGEQTGNGNAGRSFGNNGGNASNQRNNAGTFGNRGSNAGAERANAGRANGGETGGRNGSGFYTGRQGRRMGNAATGAQRQAPNYHVLERKRPGQSDRSRPNGSQGRTRDNGNRGNSDRSHG